MKKSDASHRFSYGAGRKLSGVIYLHCISDTRVGGTATRNFDGVKQICEGETLRNVIVATTMWDTISPEVGRERENQLASHDQLYKPVFDQGARMVRDDNTTESARRILQTLIDNYLSPLPLQYGTLDERMAVSQTNATVEPHRSLIQFMRKSKTELVLGRAVVDMQKKVGQLFQQFAEFEVRIQQIRETLVGDTQQNNGRRASWTVGLLVLAMVGVVTALMLLAVGQSPR